MSTFGNNRLSIFTRPEELSHYILLIFYFISPGRTQ